MYEGIDVYVYRLCINTEKKIRKIKLGNFMWYPKLDKAHHVIKHWKTRLKNHTQVHVTGSLLLQAKSLDIDDSVLKTVQDIEENIKQEYPALHEIQNKDK